MPKGVLPVRLRLLVCLSAQHSFLLLPGWLKVTVDEELEEKLFRKYLSLGDELKCRDLFFKHLGFTKKNLLDILFARQIH